jgi:hypothetical protein
VVELPASGAQSLLDRVQAVEYVHFLSLNGCCSARCSGFIMGCLANVVPSASGIR